MSRRVAWEAVWKEEEEEEEEVEECPRPVRVEEEEGGIWVLCVTGSFCLGVRWVRWVWGWVWTKAMHCGRTKVRGE